MSALTFYHTRCAGAALVFPLPPQATSKHVARSVCEGQPCQTCGETLTADDVRKTKPAKASRG